MSESLSAPEHLRRFTSIAAYNRAYPQAALPENSEQRGRLCRFDAGGDGVENDLIERDALLSIDFLPGGAPGSDEPDSVGTVVATCWGQIPVYVLAEAISLRAAWRTISERLPTTLSGVLSALADAQCYTDAL